MKKIVSQLSLALLMTLAASCEKKDETAKAATEAEKKDETAVVTEAPKGEESKIVAEFPDGAKLRMEQVYEQLNL